VVKIEIVLEVVVTPDEGNTVHQNVVIHLPN
jgi:hypothetical protein